MHLSCCPQAGTCSYQLLHAWICTLYIWSCMYLQYTILCTHCSGPSVIHQRLVMPCVFFPLQAEPLIRIMLINGLEVTDNIITYPPSTQKASASFDVHIYTTFRVVSLSVGHANGTALRQPPIIKFLAYPPGEILAKYRVTFPLMTTNMSGDYVVTVENARGMVAHTLITISRIEGKQSRVCVQFYATLRGKYSSSTPLSPLSLNCLVAWISSLSQP